MTMANKNKLTGLLIAVLLCSAPVFAQDSYEVKSPDGEITVTVTVGDKLRYSMSHKGQQILVPSAISLELENGTILGENAQVVTSDTREVDSPFEAINYVKAVVPNHYNLLTLQCRGDYGVNFRVYNEGMAYRFFTRKKGEIVIMNEEANFNFTADHKAFIPYLWDYRDGKIFNASFESLYDEINLSQFAPDSLAFVPLLVEVGQGKKAVILEADLEDYPGMFLVLNDTGKGFEGLYAPYPLEAEFGGQGNLIPTKRADYIAKVQGTRTFPWRVVILSEEDRELLDIDIVQQLASPPRIEDTSWIVPGQSAWDWWNGINLTHVDFRAGANTETYKYFADFSAANGMKYIILDGGWSSRGDLMNSAPGLDVEEIVDYAGSKGVGVILWASWVGILEQMDEAFPYYSAMGVKGWKIDFIDRDDQVAVASLYEIAEKAADNKMLVDYHGVFKPTGLHRTYPNVVGYEGVKGLENVKWADENVPRYSATIPFIRMMAGPMDYTPGAMRNANQRNFRAINNKPMSKGTRCHQLAMYVIHEVPFQMLADSPSLYVQEQECTDLITGVPTVFDETVALDGEVAEYCAIARRKGDTWYAGALCNWEPRDLILDLSFLGSGSYRAVIFEDGINADRDGTDYKRVVRNVSSGDTLDIHLAPGGGWAARIEKVR